MESRDESRLNVRGQSRRIGFGRLGRAVGRRIKWRMRMGMIL